MKTIKKGMLLFTRLDTTFYLWAYNIDLSTRYAEYRGNHVFLVNEKTFIASVLDVKKDVRDANAPIIVEALTSFGQKWFFMDDLIKRATTKEL